MRYTLADIEGRYVFVPPEEGVSLDTLGVPPYSPPAEDWEGEYPASSGSADEFGPDMSMEAAGEISFADLVRTIGPAAEPGAWREANSAPYWRMDDPTAGSVSTPGDARIFALPSDAAAEPPSLSFADLARTINPTTDPAIWNESDSAWMRTENPYIPPSAGPSFADLVRTIDPTSDPSVWPEPDAVRDNAGTWAEVDEFARSQARDNSPDWGARETAAGGSGARPPDRLAAMLEQRRGPFWLKSDSILEGGGGGGGGGGGSTAGGSGFRWGTFGGRGGGTPDGQTSGGTSPGGRSLGGSTPAGQGSSGGSSGQGSNNTGGSTGGGRGSGSGGQGTGGGGQGSGGGGSGGQGSGSGGSGGHGSGRDPKDSQLLPEPTYRDITRRDSRYINKETDFTRPQYEQHLQQKGYSLRPSKDGEAAIYENSRGEKFSIRDHSDSKGPTADYYEPGSRKIHTKIRLKK